jgi:hypothetical protein
MLDDGVRSMFGKEKTMLNKMMLCLPSEDEIEMTIEQRIPESSSLIEKTIRYKNGLQIKVIEDFTGRIFQFTLNCAKGIAGQRLLFAST